MNVGLVVVTHGEIGSALIRSAEFILGCSLDEISCIGVSQSGTEKPDLDHMADAISRADRGDGILVLTDLAFASPTNAIESLLGNHRARIVSGLNLPMLLRTWNYRGEDLESLADRAETGGTRGIESRAP